jgi:hypothetical protein
MLHREGQPKARVCASVLGITAGSADVLRRALRLPLSTAKGTGTVLSVWIVRHGEDFPRLTTCSANKRTGGFFVILQADDGPRCDRPSTVSRAAQGDSTPVERLKLSSAVRPLADYVADIGDEMVVLTEGNRVVAAIVPLKNVDRESLALSQHPEFLELIARSQPEFALGRTISLDEMKRRVLARRSPNRCMQPTARKARCG